LQKTPFLAVTVKKYLKNINTNTESALMRHHRCLFIRRVVKMNSTPIQITKSF
jgi:hypothetical protein